MIDKLALIAFSVLIPFAPYSKLKLLIHPVLDIC